MIHDYWLQLDHNYIDTDQYAMVLQFNVYVSYYNSFSSVTKMIGDGIAGGSQMF
jgi:hypothetical protein